MSTKVRIRTLAITRVAALLSLTLAVGGCGDKTPESEAAKELGNQPKQTLDNVQNKLDDSAATGAERLQDADNKINAPGEGDAAKAP